MTNQFTAEQIAAKQKELTDKTVNSLLNEEFIKSDTSMSEEEKAQKLHELFDQVQKKVLAGYTVILDDIEANKSKNALSSSLLPYLPDLEKLKKLFKSSDYIAEQLKQREDFASIFGFREDAVMYFYEIACKLYDNQKFEDASNAFYFLCFIKPNVSIFWLEFARCEVTNHHPKEAAYSYQLACNLDEENPLVYIEAIRELIKINEVDDAKVIFNDACEVAHSHQNDQSFKELCDFINDPECECLKD